MNLKPIFFFILCLQLLKTGYAQVTATLTKDYNLPLAATELIQIDSNKFLHYDEINIKARAYSHKNGLEVIQLNNKGSIAHKTAIQNGEVITDKTLDLKKVGNKIFMLYKSLEDQTGNSGIAAVEIDPQTLSAGPPKIIGGTEKADKKLIDRDKISLYNSPDQQYNLLFASNENKYFISVLDKNLVMQWYKTGILNEDSWTRIQSVTIDNSGTVFIAYKIIADKRSDIASLNHVVAFTQKQEKDIPILLGDETLVNNIHLLLSSDGNRLYVAGGYYEGVKNYNKSMGIYNASINRITYTFEKKFEKHPFPDTFVSQMANDSWGTSKKGIQSNYNSQLFEMNDGSLDMVCGYVPNSESAKALTNAYTGPMFNIRLSKEGTFFSRIPRFRISAAPFVTKFGNHVGSWYYAKAYKNKIFIFYNDHPKNLLQPIDQKVDRSDVYTTHVVAAAIIEANGQAQRKILLDMSEEHFIAIPEDIMELSDSLLLVPIHKVKMGSGDYNEYRMAYFKFD